MASDAEIKEEKDVVTLMVVNLIVVLLLTVLYVLTVNKTIRKIKLYFPPASVLIILGLILGAIVATGDDVKKSLAFSPEIFFNFLLPPIIFNAGFTLDKPDFFRNLGSIMTFAFVGTSISCFFIGGMLYHVNTDFQMTMPESMALGSLISAVDPVSTMAVFREVGVHPNLYNIVFGESILNDAVSIVINRVFNDLADENRDAGGTEILTACGYIVLIGIASIMIGVIFGLMSAYIHKKTSLRDHPSLELAMALCFAYLPYTVAEACRTSGIMALLFAGITMDHYTFYNFSNETRASTKSLFDMLAHVSEAFVFVYLGMAAFTVETHSMNAFNAITTLIWCIMGRIMHVIPLAWLLNKGRKYKIDYRQQVILCMSGIRGAVAFALALDSSVYVSTFVTTTLVIVFITTLVFGGTTYPVIRWLKMRSNDEEEDLPAVENSHHWFLSLDERYLKPMFRMPGSCRESDRGDNSRPLMTTGEQSREGDDEVNLKLDLGASSGRHESQGAFHDEKEYENTSDAETAV